MKTFRNPSNIHAPVAGYVHQIEISGPQRWLVISGQVGKREDGTLPSDPVEQLQAALENLKRNLEAAGMKKTDLIKVTFYLAGEMEAQKRGRGNQGLVWQV